MRISDWSSDVCSSDLLEPGMVVTIEPGIYVIDMLLEKLKQDGHADAIDWPRIDAFRPYGGIRIEDDVVCTAGDPVNLTREEFATEGCTSRTLRHKPSAGPASPPRRSGPPPLG